MDQVGIVLFGHQEGFTIFYIDGCAKNYLNGQSIEENKDIVKILRLNLDKINILANEYIWGVVHDQMEYSSYSFLIKYRPSRDSFGRSAFEGVAVVFKDCLYDPEYLYNKFDALFIELDKSKNIKNSITNFSEISNEIIHGSFNWNMQEVINKKIFFLAPQDKEIKLLKKALTGSFYKCYVAKDSFISSDEYEEVNASFEGFSTIHPKNSVVDFHESNFQRSWNDRTYKNNNKRISIYHWINRYYKKKYNLLLILFLMFAAYFLWKIFNNSENTPAVNPQIPENKDHSFEENGSSKIDTGILDFNPNEAQIEQYRREQKKIQEEEERLIRIEKNKQKNEARRKDSLRKEIITYTTESPYDKSKTKSLKEKAIYFDLEDSLTQLLILHQRDFGKDQNAIATKRKNTQYFSRYYQKNGN